MRGKIAKILRKLTYGAENSHRVRQYQEINLCERTRRDPETKQIVSSRITFTLVNVGLRAHYQKLKAVYREQRKQGKFLRPNVAGAQP